jgi:hypothetical protein
MLAAKLAIVATVAWFASGTLVKAWEQIGQQQWELHFGWLALAGVLYLLGMLPAGLFWYRVLRVLGQEAQLGETLRAYYIGHLGKYVPGKVMVVVIRAGMIRSHRVHAGVAAASVFVETLTMMAVGACIAAGIIATMLYDESLMLWTALGLMLVAGLPTVPPVFRRLARLAGVGKSDPTTAENLSKLGYGTLLLGWLLMGVVWLATGCSLWAVFRALGVELGLWEHLAGYTAAVSLAMVAGFLSLIPGGLGVRDLILLKLIVTLFGESGVTEAIATVTSALLRLVWLVAELVISGILYVVKR